MKKIHFLIVSLVLCMGLFAQTVTKVTKTISPLLNTLPVVMQDNVSGGYHQVSDVAGRDALPAGLKQTGMLVWVQATHAAYQWDGAAWRQVQLVRNWEEGASFYIGDVFLYQNKMVFAKTAGTIAVAANPLTDAINWNSIVGIADATAADNTLRWNGTTSKWVESTALKNDGVNITVGDGTTTLNNTTSDPLLLTGAGLKSQTATNAYSELVIDNSTGAIRKAPVFSALSDVLDNTLSTPPVSPSMNDAYIVFAPGAGAWAGHDNAIAKWDGSAWTYYSPASNDQTSVSTGVNAGKVYTWSGTAWSTVLVASKSALSQLTAATAVNTIDNTNFAQTWNWSSATTQNPLTLNANALTTGTLLGLNANVLTSGIGLNISSTAPATTGSLLKVASSSTGAFSSGGVLFDFSGVHTGAGFRINDNTTTGYAQWINGSGAYTGAGFWYLGTQATTGVAAAIFANALTSGIGLNISSTSTSATGSLLNVASSSTGAFANGGVRFNFSGAHTGSGFLINDVTTTGSAQWINGSGAYTGAGLWRISTPATTGTAATITTTSLTSGNALSVTGASAITGSLGDFVNAGASNSTNGLLRVFNNNASTTGTVFRAQSNSTAGTGLTVLANGNTGLGTTIPVATLHNAGTTVYSTAALTDFTANGAIGTAAATVDAYTSINIPQSTAGITLTIPVPTNTTAGRVLKVSNTGTSAVTVGTTSIGTGQTAEFVYNGTAWTNPATGAASFSGLTNATATNTVDNTTLAQTWGWTTATTQNPLTLNANALTTGTLLGLSTGALTSGKALSVTGASAITGSLGDFVNTGASSSTNGLLRVFNNNASTTGTVFRAQSNSTAGTGLTVLANGNTGLGTATPVATLHNAGTTVYSTAALTDFTANGAIGTAAATVDAYTSINIPQTTAGITLTLPAPTNTTPGRVLKVSNTGTSAVTVGTTSIGTGQTAEFVYNGTAWTNPATGAASFSGLTNATATNTVDNTTLAQTWGWTTATTQNPLTLNANALTTGTLLGLSTGALTSGKALSVTGASAITGSLGDFVNTGASSSTNGLLRVFNNNASTTGTVFRAQSNSTAGTGLTVLANGNTGLGTASPVATLHNAGSTVYSTLTLTNFTANGVLIGTAAATVDAYTSIIIPQTTAGITVYLPTPTNTTLGRVVKVSNTGSTAVTVQNILIGKGQTAEFVYSGGGYSWINQAASSVPLSGLTAATATNSINNANYNQTWTWNSATTESPLFMSANALTSGTLLGLNVSALTSGKALYVTGASAITGSLGDFVNTGASNSTNGLLRVFNNNASTTGTVFRAQSNSTAGTGLTVLANGNTGLGIATPVATLHNAGTTVYSTAALANFTANGAIGTAAATVDAYTSISIPQTTAGITLTIPAPTSATAGRVLKVSNTGTIAVTVGTTSIGTGETAEFCYNGTSWANPAKTGWGLTGNAGTTAGTNFIGTTDNVDVVFKRNSVFSGKLAGGSTSLGFNALVNHTTGFNNTAFGAIALRDVTLGSDNTAIGAGALPVNTGYYNTAVGSQALNSFIAGNYNTAIGYNADNAKTIGTNCTAIGYGASTAGNSNWVEIGNTSVLTIHGQVAYTNASDKRVKTNIRENVPGLGFIMKLKPISYNFNLEAQDRITGAKADTTPAGLASRKKAEAVVHTGFAAQDVEQALNELGYDFDGLNKPQNQQSLYSLGYATFTVPLVKAVQEQQATIQEQQKQLTLQQQQIEQLRKMVEELMKK